MKLEDLQQRHQDVAHRVGDGATYEQIAGEMGISPRTVRHYVKDICEKLPNGEYAGLEPKIAVMKWYLQESQPV